MSVADAPSPAWTGISLYSLAAVCQDLSREPQGATVTEARETGDEDRVRQFLARDQEGQLP